MVSAICTDWRAKIGLITPMSENAEHDVPHLRAGGCVLCLHENQLSRPHAGGIDHPDRSAGGNSRHVQGLRRRPGGLRLHLRAAASRASAGIRSASARFERASGKPGLTTSTAVLEALHTLGTKKVAVLDSLSASSLMKPRRSFWRTTASRLPTLWVWMLATSAAMAARWKPAMSISYIGMQSRWTLRGADTFFLSCMGLSTTGDPGGNGDRVGNSRGHQPPGNTVERTAPLPRRSQRLQTGQAVYAVKRTERTDCMYRDGMYTSAR